MQEIIAGLIVIAAFGYVVLRFWGLVRGDSRNACGKCSGCCGDNGASSDLEDAERCSSPIFPRELLKPMDTPSRD